jgi:hypothetical protein
MSMKRFFSFLMLVMSFGGAALAQQGPGWINAGSNELPELEGAELSVSAYESPAAMAMMAMMIGEGAAAPPPPILDAGNEADVITAGDSGAGGRSAG